MSKGTLLILGDLDPTPDQISRLDSLVGKVVVCDSGDPEQDALQIDSADYVFACNFRLTPFIDKLLDVELVVMAETGFATIDIDGARAAGVNVTNISSYSTLAVAQYILFCVVDSSRQWDKVFSDFKTGKTPGKIGTGLEALIVGFLGFGTIGQKAHDALAAFAPRVIAHTRGSNGPHAGVESVSLDDLFTLSDVVVVCVEKNPGTKGLIDADRLARLSPGSTLVSVSQRAVFNDRDLVEFLRQRQDVTAYLDFDPRESDDDLLRLPNARMSPHLAFYTQQTLENRVDECIAQLETFLHKK